MAIASGTWTNGTNGSGTWEISDSGVLTISGTGKMYDYSFINYSNRPWASYKASIKSVIIGSGITKIGNMCCYGFSALEKITISNTVTSVGNNCFQLCPKVNTIVFEGNQPNMSGSQYPFSLGANATNSATATVYTSGWGSDSVFTSSIKGNYTTFIYVTGLPPAEPEGVEIPVNVSGSWKASTPYVNVNGEWKEVTNAYVNVSGTWKEVV